VVSAVSVIAVGYDGSENALAALRWGAALAARTGAELRIVHAVGLLEHAGMTAGGPHREAAMRIADEAGVEAAHVVWKACDGEPSSVLCRESAEGADLLVVGTRGAAAHPGLLGSTSLELAEHSPVPVVIVPT
jgi:nucleotide-binding universal stress UspA family protein